MKFTQLCWLGLPLFVLTMGIAFGDNELGGSVGHLQITRRITHRTAAMGEFEGGSRHYRASGTLGWKINAKNRVKLTGEYLTQSIDYGFRTGVTRQWVKQGAGGVDYQYALGGKFDNYFNLSGFYSHASSTDLNATTGTDGETTFTDYRHIAGSDAGGINPGITSHLWRGNKTTLSANWDNVHYRKIYSPIRNAEGFGGKFSIAQLFRIHSQQFKISASAADRAPFDDFTTEIDWIKSRSPGHLRIGAYTDLTHGKQTLPSIAIIGIKLSCTLDNPEFSHRTESPIIPISTSSNNNATSNGKNLDLNVTKPTIVILPSPAVTRSATLLSWMNNPAVYMPQVLAIPDENIVNDPSPDPNPQPCADIPAFSGTIPAQVDNATGSIGNRTITVDTAPYFTGSSLIYSATLIGQGGAVFETTPYVNSSTGVLTVTYDQQGIQGVATVFITARNSCGSADSNSFTLTYNP